MVGAVLLLAPLLEAAGVNAGQLPSSVASAEFLGLMQSGAGAVTPAATSGQPKKGKAYEGTYVGYPSYSI